MARDNLTICEAKQRINAQKSDSFYIENADFVIYNNENESDLKTSVGRIIKGS